MADEKYILEENPIYKDDDIRKLQNVDKANAESTFNPLFLRILNNIKALFKLVSNKVDKVEGKGLSTNDYTTVDKDALGELSSPLVTDIYISNSGSDTTGDGTEAKPYQTVGFVLDMLEGTKYNGASITILLQGGQTFNLTSTVNTIVLSHLSVLNIQATTLFSTRATLNVTLESFGSLLITREVSFTDINLFLTKIGSSQYNSFSTASCVKIIRCEINSKTGASLSLNSDGLIQTLISLHATEVLGTTKLVASPAGTGIILIRAYESSFADTTLICHQYKSLSDMIKIGDWYTTGGSILTPMTYICWPYHPDAAQIKSGGVNDITFASKLFIYNLANAPTGNSTYGWLETDYVESGGFAPSPYGNLIQTFKYFYDPSVIYTRRATKSSAGVWTWEDWICLSPPSVSPTAPTAFIGEGVQHQTY